MLAMQVVTKKRFELWHVFGGHPMRFSLAEFGYVTGEFEAGYLIVHPMMELGEDKEAGSGEFDCEIHDRKVGYMVEILKAWHKFQKCEWGGGDSAETKCEDELVDNRMV
ncbi:hypothetical protein Bca52824_087913 [Brassica carinata]|uniref:DUF1985 domain-containing protein n=1 Tax=Brassica carinata TaxID=52824 RepID=A0A8X7PBN0_BRACI|nr:hypothetical protein Bca52824_087913 [Brassica carinata]